jgi:hypothetical protein
MKSKIGKINKSPTIPPTTNPIPSVRRPIIK